MRDSGAGDLLRKIAIFFGEDFFFLGRAFFFLKGTEFVALQMTFAMNRLFCRLCVEIMCCRYDKKGIGNEQHILQILGNGRKRFLMRRLSFGYQAYRIRMCFLH